MSWPSTGSLCSLHKKKQIQCFKSRDRKVWLGLSNSDVNIAYSSSKVNGTLTSKCAIAIWHLHDVCQHWSAPPLSVLRSCWFRASNTHKHKSRCENRKNRHCTRRTQEEGAENSVTAQSSGDSVASNSTLPRQHIHYFISSGGCHGNSTDPNNAREK